MVKLNTESTTQTVEREVSDATQKLQIRDIVENAKNVKRLTNKLCEQLAQVEDTLEELVEKNDLTEELEAFDFKGFGLSSFDLGLPVKPFAFDLAKLPLFADYADEK